jgi:hypothetical protein
VVVISWRVRHKTKGQYGDVAHILVGGFQCAHSYSIIDNRPKVAFGREVVKLTFVGGCNTALIPKEGVTPREGHTVSGDVVISLTYR